MTKDEIKNKIIGDKKILAVIIVGILGMIFLLLSSFSEKTIVSEGDMTDKDDVKISSSSDISEIEKNLEIKLKSMISEIKGAGEADVMITLASTGEIIYAENEKNNSGDNSSVTDREIVIYKPTSNSDSGLIVRIDSPEISGVAVVCDGGESAIIVAEIKKMVTSLFGIGSDKVYVGPKTIK